MRMSKLQAEAVPLPLFAAGSEGNSEHAWAEPEHDFARL